MKKLLPLFCLFLSTASFGQAFLEVPEDKPTNDNGIEYSYAITNEREESDYARYEVSIFARNNSGCQLIYLQRNDLSTLFEGDPSAIARFECLNASGKRLTSKGANLKARQFYVPYRQPEKNAEGKTVYRNVNVPAGYLLRNGESVTNTLIVIVPKGERPRFKCRIQRFSELTAD